MSTPETPGDGGVVKTVWPIDALAEAVYVNAISVTSGPPLGVAGPDEDGSIYVALGHLAPPMIAGPEDLVRLGGEVQVLPRAAVVLTTGRARELHDLLGRSLSGLAATEAVQEAEQA